MDSIYGQDPTEYWVKVIYDDGYEETFENLTLNQAYNLQSTQQQEQQRQYRDWIYPMLDRHIKYIKYGRTT